MSLPEALERAATSLPADADLIRPANGDPLQLLASLDAAAAARLLTWVLVNEPDAGEDLVVEWCEDERGIEPLQAIDQSSLPKPGRKLLRKAIHRMRTSGIEIVESTHAEPVVSRLGTIADEISGAYMTAVDPRGSYLVFLVEAHPSGGARLFQVLLDEVRGVVEFDVYATNRSKVRGFVRKLTESKSAGAVEVDSDIVRGLILRVAAIHPRDLPLPRAFSEWRRKLEDGAVETTPGQRLRDVLTAGGSAPISAAEASEACGRVAEMVKAQELGPWLPAGADLAETTEKLEAEVDSLMKLDGEARDAALELATSGAAASLFAGDHANRTASRLEVSAYVASRANRLEESRDFLAAADGFRDGGADRNPVARAMLEIYAASILKRVENDSQEAGDDSTSETES